MNNLLVFISLYIICIVFLCDKDVKKDNFASGFIRFILMCDIIVIVIEVIIIIGGLK